MLFLLLFKWNEEELGPSPSLLLLLLPPPRDGGGEGERRGRKGIEIKGNAGNRPPGKREKIWILQ